MQAVAQLDKNLGVQLNQMMTELHELVSQAQMTRLHSTTWREQTIARCQELNRRISEIMQDIDAPTHGTEASMNGRWQQLRTQYAQTWEDHRKALNERLETVAIRLRTYSNELSQRPNIQAIQSLYQTLSAGYEDLTEEILRLRQVGLLTTARARHLKPINYARNIFHAAMGIGSVLLYHFLLSRSAALAILISVLSVFSLLEITRRFSNRWNNFLMDTVFRWIARPHERTKVNGSTWYVIALVLLVVLFPKPVVFVGALVLALADPAASLAGKFWGKRIIVGTKTWMGSLVFLLVAFGVSLPFAISVHGLPLALLAALVIALVACLAELFITKLDDNFSIPVVTACIAWLVFF